MRRPAPQNHSPDMAQCLFLDSARRQRARQAARCTEPEPEELDDGSVASLSLLEDGRAVFCTDAELDPRDILDALKAAIELIRGELEDEQPY
jgi:hypothetical protein